MSWVAHCDGSKGLGDPLCKAMVHTGPSARIPPAVGWSIVSNPTGDGVLVLCKRCTDIHYQRLLLTPAGGSSTP